MTKFDDAVVGAGILGLAHAYQLAKRGRSVAVFERNPKASGASVRNFGMVWPIGQSIGLRRDTAKRSREIWLQVLREAGIWFNPVGSLHVAYHDDEAQVLREFAEISNRSNFPVSILDPKRAKERSPFVRLEGLQLGLFSEHETGVDPRQVVAELPKWLEKEFGVQFFYSHAATEFERPNLQAGGRLWQADRLWVCAGDDLQTLYPESFRSLGLIACKLQMMRTAPLNTRIGPLLAAGLTLQHYLGFADCPTLPALKRRLAREYPRHEQFGIHVMVSQTECGELTLGDSHEYGDAIEPFDKREIDELILDYLRTFFAPPELRIVSRWNGIYVKSPTEPWTILRPADGATATAAARGAGMTLSFGLAEKVIHENLD